MNLPLSEDLIAEANAHDADALGQDYAALDRRLARSGIAIYAIKDRVAAFSIAVMGCRARGHAFRQVPDPGRADQYPRKAGRLRGHQPTFARHLARVAALYVGQGFRQRRAARRSRHVGSRLRSGQFEHLPGPVRPAAQLCQRIALLDRRESPRAGDRAQYRMHRNRPPNRLDPHSQVGRATSTTASTATTISIRVRSTRTSCS